ncbi:hypothetical protein HOY82DRAFT_639659 [Tuber indicum]|nr:hypothetical protein HOY82DRAFT_639659 [Tuber indicum]
MATLAFKPYTYKPTPPRSKSAATSRRPVPKEVNIFNKLQQIKLSSTSLSTPRPVAAAMAAADRDGGCRPRIRGRPALFTDAATSSVHYGAGRGGFWAPKHRPGPSCGPGRGILPGAHVFQGPAGPVTKPRPLCENSTILSIGASKPPQADINLLNWEAESIAPMQLKVWPRASADRDTKTLVDDKPEGLQQEVKGAAVELTAKRADEEPHPMKRKQSSSYPDGPMHKKPKYHFQQRPTGQLGQCSKPHKCSLKLHSSPDQASRVAVVLSPQARPSIPNATDTDMPPDYGNLDRLSRAVLLMLAKATFIRTAHIAAPSQHHMGKVDDFTIKPIEQHSFLVTGFSRYTPSQLLSDCKAVSTAPEAGRTHKDTTRPQPQYGKAMHAKLLASQESELSSSDDAGDLSDGDPDVSSDEDGCSSEAEKQGGLSVRMNIPWDPVDEQRLVAWKKEGKPCDWIFKRFPGRTHPAIRTRWRMAHPRSE